MQFDSFAAFIQMGGYGPFVWSVYFLGVAVLLFNVLQPMAQRRKFYREQIARQVREEV